MMNNMVHRFSFAALTLIPLLAITSLPVQARDIESERSFLSLSIGAYDALDHNTAIDFRAEYRPYLPQTGAIQPWIGAEITSAGTLWGGGGALMNFNLGRGFTFTPSVGVGLYAKGGSDLDLNYPLEFRTQAELNYQFGTGQRIGLAVSHMSNLGLGDHNPGTETIGIYYHIPY